MKYLKKRLWLLVFIPLLVATSVDRRHESGRFTVARYEFATQTFPATASAALAPTLTNLNGTIYAIEIVTTDTEDGITYTTAITSGNSASLFSEGSLADNSTHWRDAESEKVTQDADFNPIPVASTLTCTITPSAAPDNSSVGAKTATVKVILYMR